MRHQDTHVPEQDLLALADHELPADRMHEIEAHIAMCWSCRARMHQLEGTIDNFVRLYHERLDPQLPPSAGSRSLLAARMAETSQSQPPRPMWLQLARSNIRGIVGSAAAMLLLAVALISWRQNNGHEYRASQSQSTTKSIPNRHLTPGAILPVNLSEVCSAGHGENNRLVSASLAQKVFQEYGMSAADPSDYEVDFLITPGLGGSDDIHNLWPEPYASTDWSASVKDALEDRLHQMVCNGQIDLPTAQNEIATDWIRAYKKYFHTDRPLTTSAKLSFYGDRE